MRVRFTAATPVRVGGREQQVTKLEFLHHEGMVHVVSPAKLGKLLLEKSERTLEDWNVDVLSKGQGANLTAFLRGQGLLSVGSIREISRYSSASSHPGMNRFQPHARDGRETVFVPGSALKGALRAAVLWKLVDKERANRYVHDKARSKARFDARRLDQEVLQSYRLPGRELRAGPNFDLLRAVKVSDGYGSLETRVEKIVIQSYVEGRGGDRRTMLGASETVYAESLVPGSWAEFDLSVDGKLLALFRKRSRDLPFSDERSLLALVQNFYEEVWGFERRYYGVEADSASVSEAPPAFSEVPSFEEWLSQEKDIEAESLSRRKRRPYQAEYRRTFDLFEGSSGKGQRSTSSGRTERTSGVADGEVRVAEIREYYTLPCPGFRLGWGSGLMGTTVDMHLNPENMGKVLQLIDSRHHRGEPRDGPKSRKIVESEGRPKWPMGWARLEATE
jgi:CRISPR type III-A-associated RAMP protein Csm5